MSDAILVALITGAFSFSGVYFSNRKNAAIIEVRLANLERKVEAHNHLVERMYSVEEKQAVTDEKIKVVNNRLKDLEAKQ